MFTLDDPDSRIWSKGKRKDWYIFPHIVLENDRIIVVVTCSPEGKGIVTLNKSAIDYLRECGKRAVVHTASGENQDDVEQPSFARRALAHPVASVNIDTLYEALQDAKLHDGTRFDPKGFYVLLKTTGLPTKPATKKPLKSQLKRLI